jgi:hypothetical protein
VEVYVGQQRRGTSALRRSFLHSYPFPILPHAGAGEYDVIFTANASGALKLVGELVAVIW